MNTYLRFFYEFISIFFDGLFDMFKGMYNGIVKMFNYKDYARIIESYKESLNGNETLFMFLLIAFMVIIIGLIGLLVYLFVKRMIRRRQNKLNREDLLNEIYNLNDKVNKLMKEKEDIMAMKVSQLGIKPNEDENNDTESSENSDEEVIDNPDVRFSKLITIDEEFKNYRVKNYENSFTLE